jgi:hypothetical protein
MPIFTHLSADSLTWKNPSERRANEDLVKNSLLTDMRMQNSPHPLVNSFFAKGSSGQKSVYIFFLLGA